MAAGDMIVAELAELDAALVDAGRRYLAGDIKAAADIVSDVVVIAKDVAAELRAANLEKQTA